MNAKNGNIKLENRRTYHWNQCEQKRYINYLVDSRDLFESSSTARRLAGVHTQMSRIIKTRDSKQCKSHHQKMIRKYKSIESILWEHEGLICKIESER